MFTTGYLCASDLNRFMTRSTIHELGLDDGETVFYIDTIDDGDNISPGQHQSTAPVFMPSYFSSMLYINQSDMPETLRPMSHELVSPDDEIVRSNGRTWHTHSNCWSPSTTTPIPAYQDIRQSNLYSPSSLFSLSSSSLNEEERQIHLQGRKFTDLSSTHSSDSLDSGSDDAYYTLGREQTAIKIPKPDPISSRLSRIRKHIKGSIMWYSYLIWKINTDNSISCRSTIFSLIVYNFWP